MTTEHLTTQPKKESLQFIYSLNTTNIDQNDCDWSSILDDASIVMGAVTEQIRMVAMSKDMVGAGVSTPDLLFGTLYLAELAHTLINQAHDKALAANKVS